MPDFSFVILRINLSQKKIQEEIIRPSWTDKFLGGRGLGAKILFDELAPHVDALSAENKLLFLTGPLLGTGAPWCVWRFLRAQSSLCRVRWAYHRGPVG
jgi:aldehyde:ferredoxin oxidoreductase